MDWSASLNLGGYTSSPTYGSFLRGSNLKELHIPQSIPEGQSMDQFKSPSKPSMHLLQKKKSGTEARGYEEELSSPSPVARAACASGDGDDYISRQLIESTVVAVTTGKEGGKDGILNIRTREDIDPRSFAPQRTNWANIFMICSVPLVMIIFFIIILSLNDATAPILADHVRGKLRANP